MTADRFRDLQDLFANKWDFAILDVVAQGPYRYRGLARAARRAIDPDLTETTVTRSLARLREHGLVGRTTGDGPDREFPVYRLTPEGRRALAAYHAMRNAYEDGP